MGYRIELWIVHNTSSLTSPEGADVLKLHLLSLTFLFWQTRLWSWSSFKSVVNLIEAIPYARSETVKHLIQNTDTLPFFLRRCPVSQHQCTAGSQELQRPSLYCVPLANWSLGSVHRGLLQPIHQLVCGPNTWWWCILLSGNADSQSHLCSCQRGPGSSKKVRLLIISIHAKFGHKMQHFIIWKSHGLEF